MCGRFTIAITIGLAERFQLPVVPSDLIPRYNIAPSEEVPVITPAAGRRQERTLCMMRWGLGLYRAASNPGYPLINVRSESLSHKPAFRDLLIHHRCLVPATGFYEWRIEGKRRQPWYITRKDRNLFAFAGLFTDRPGEPRTFAIITTPPNGLVAPLHDRMPAILEREDENGWLTDPVTDPRQVIGYLVPAPPEDLDTYRVSRLVNTPGVESPEFIRPIVQESLS
ncbi:MAG: SOS response-associated peptidase [Methanoregulaceae archaeon]|nr:SOS response-associated peptidase [Methanoregulaceae archaeon]